MTLRKGICERLSRKRYSILVSACEAIVTYVEEK